MSTINMQTMRYLNLLDRTTRVKTSKCYFYNNAVVFAVPKFMLAKAIGPDAINIKRIQEQLGKRVRIIKEAESINDLKKFVEDVVYPIKFKSIEVKDITAVITAGGTQSKAALFGRDKKRFEELKEILRDTFQLDLRIA